MAFRLVFRSVLNKRKQISSKMSLCTYMVVLFLVCFLFAAEVLKCKEVSKEISSICPFYNTTVKEHLIHLDLTTVLHYFTEMFTSGCSSYSECARARVHESSSIICRLGPIKFDCNFVIPKKEINSLNWGRAQTVYGLPRCFLLYSQFLSFAPFPNILYAKKKFRKKFKKNFF